MMRSIDFTKHGTLLLTCVFMTVVRSPLLAEDRPSFQSPTEMGVSSEENLPLEWVSSESATILCKFSSHPLLRLSGTLNNTFQQSTQKPNS